ncbi:MAG: mechanosensitive ion channel domain-containing protein, partial [Pseudomonadota bacterium]
MTIKRYKPTACLASRWLSAFSFLVLFLSALLPLSAQASSQSAAALAVSKGEPDAMTTTLPDDFSVDDVDSLVAPLTDDQTRQLLLQTLQRQASDRAVQEGASSEDVDFSSLLENLRAGSANAIASMDALIEALPRTGEIIEHAFILLTDLQGWPRMFAGVGNLALMIIVGLIAAWFAGRFLRSFLTAPAESHSPASQWEKLVALVVRAVPEIGQLVAFTIAGRIVSLLFFDRFDPMRLFLIGWFSALGIGGGALVLARVLFAPAAEKLRLPRLTDSVAKHVSKWFVAVVFTTAFCALNAGMFLLLAVPDVLVSVWHILCGFLIMSLTLATLKRTQHHIRDSVSSDPTHEPLRSSFASNHVGLIMTGVIVLFAIWAARSFAGEIREAAGAGLAAVAFAAAWYTRRVGAQVRFMSQMPEHMHRFDAASTVLPAVFVGMGVIGLVQALFVDLASMADTPVGQEVTVALLKVAITIAVSALIWTVLSRIITRFIEREHAKAVEEVRDLTGDSEGGSRVVSSRLGTLLPLFRGFALTVVAIITFMIVLSSFGVDIGPLLAGAGVVGIALGFGAQALVKDIISGIFFLIDDAFRVGEYIEFDQYRGEVERISIRSMRLRHHRGAVQTIPFGELLVVVNHNRDWVIYKQEFQV